MKTVIYRMVKCVVCHQRSQGRYLNDTCGGWCEARSDRSYRSPHTVARTHNMKPRVLKMGGYPRDTHLSLVLCSIDWTEPFVVWLFNHDTGGFDCGSYCETLDKALAEFDRRLK